MAAQYTEVSLEDMERFLKRGYRALRPKQGVQGGEYYYDLSLSPVAVIRVLTSVKRSTGSGAGVGEDAIRIQFLGLVTKRPLVPGKAPIVKRTQNWRNSLQTKIEDYIEMYEEKATYWDSQGAPSSESPSAPNTPRPSGGGGPPPTDKQVNFVKRLMSQANVDDLEAEGFFTKYRELKWPFDETNIRSMPIKRVSQMIDDLISAVGYTRRYAAGDPAEYEASV